MVENVEDLVQKQEEDISELQVELQLVNSKLAEQATEESLCHYFQLISDAVQKELGDRTPHSPKKELAEKSEIDKHARKCQHS